MIDLILLYFVLSKGIYPLAKAKGKSSANWMLFTFATWMFVELSILAISVSPILFFIAYSKKPYVMFFSLLNYKLMVNDFRGIIFVYCMAVLGGFLSSLVIRRSLSRAKEEQFHEPPVPEAFV